MAEQAEEPYRAGNQTGRALKVPPCITDFLSVALCRHGGEDTPRSDVPFTVCPACADSPLCDLCGHPRGDHGQVFIRGVMPGCDRRIGDFQTLTSRTCDCPGFRPIKGPVSDATFARTDVETDDPPLPQLRVVG
jgi:hypothetical protein